VRRAWEGVLGENENGEEELLGRMENLEQAMNSFLRG